MNTDLLFDTPEEFLDYLLENSEPVILEMLSEMHITPEVIKDRIVFTRDTGKPVRSIVILPVLETLKDKIILISGKPYISKDAALEPI